MDKKFLEEKQKEIQAGLERWAKRKGILGEKEQISVVIKVKTKGRQRIVISEILTLGEEDWNKIFSINSHWTDLQRRILEIFKENNSASIKVNEIMERLGRWFSPGMFDVINRTLSDRNLPYKIYRLNPYERDARMWPDNKYQIVVIS